MAKKNFRRKVLKRPKRKRPIRRGRVRGRRRLGGEGGETGYPDLDTLIALGKAAKMAYDAAPEIPPGPHLRGTGGTGVKKKKKARLGGLMPAGTAATVKYSRGLRIGKPRKSTFREKVMAVHYPSLSFNSKWTFQMDCKSAFVSACQIPILTKQLLDPISDQLYTNMTTDVSGVTIPTMAPNNGFSNDQYSIMIHSYKCNLRFYNSSTNTLRARLVWYKPKDDLDAQYDSNGVHTNNPLNLLMLASNVARATTPAVTTFVGDGLNFDSTTSGSNFTADYNHAGWPLVGTSTTSTSTANTVAFLDPSLVPGSAQVRRMFNNFYSTLKSEDFQLEPGNQFNTSLTMMGKHVTNVYDDVEVTIRKDCSVIGIVYVLGQMVFNENEGNSLISTGSSQLSVMREDTCYAQPRFLKEKQRVNMTNPYQVIHEDDQAKINDETGDIQTTYTSDK